MLLSHTSKTDHLLVNFSSFKLHSFKKCDSHWRKYNVLQHIFLQIFDNYVKSDIKIKKFYSKFYIKIKY